LVCQELQGHLLIPFAQFCWDIQRQWKSEVSSALFGLGDAIGLPTIPNDSPLEQVGARKISSGAIGLMAPKPKTAGSFIKADTNIDWRLYW